METESEKISNEEEWQEEDDVEFFLQQKKIRIGNDNSVRSAELTISPEKFWGDVEWRDFDCVDERKNFAYVDKKKTDRLESITYFCSTKNGIIRFKSLNLKTLFPDGFFDEDLEEVNTKIRVPVAKARITPYKTEYGVTFLSIVVPFVERV